MYSNVRHVSLSSCSELYQPDRQIRKQESTSNKCYKNPIMQEISLQHHQAKNQEWRKFWGIQNETPQRFHDFNSQRAHYDKDNMKKFYQQSCEDQAIKQRKKQWKKQIERDNININIRSWDREQEAREQTRRAVKEQLKNHYESAIEEKRNRERMAAELNSGIYVHPSSPTKAPTVNLQKFYNYDKSARFQSDSPKAGIMPTNLSRIDNYYPEEQDSGDEISFDTRRGSNPPAIYNVPKATGHYRDQAIIVRANSVIRNSSNEFYGVMQAVKGQNSNPSQNSSPPSSHNVSDVQSWLSLSPQNRNRSLLPFLKVGEGPNSYKNSPTNRLSPKGGIPLAKMGIHTKIGEHTVNPAMLNGRPVARASGKLGETQLGMVIL